MDLSKPLLGRENSILASLATVGLVVAIYNASAGPVADVHATQANDLNMGKGISKGGWLSVATVAGIFLLAKDLNVVILGGAAIGVEELFYRHAWMTHPDTGQIAPPMPGAYVPAGVATPPAA